MKTYLVIELRDFERKTAIIKSVDHTTNIKTIANRIEVVSISAYTKLYQAQAQVNMLLKLYKQQEEGK